MARLRGRIPTTIWCALLAVALVIVLFLPSFAQWLGLNFYVRFMTRVIIFAIAALSLDLILGYGGMVSFGHAAFIGLSGYVVAILSYHATHGALHIGPIAIRGTQSAWIAWPAAIAVTAMVALIIGAVSLRTTGLSFIMVTLAFAQMIYFFFLALRQYGGEEGLTLDQRSVLPGLSIENKVVFYYFALAILALCLIVCGRIVHSRFGRVLRGCMQNERRMRAIGFPTYRYKLTAFVMSAVIAAIAGILLVNNEGFTSTADLNWLRSADLIIMVLIGGLGTLWGPVLGAFVWMSLTFVLESYTIHWPVIAGPVLVVIVLFARGGLLRLAVPLGRRTLG